MKRILIILGLLLATTQVEAVPYVNVKAIMPTILIAHEIEKKHGIPENLLMAIGHVESGNKHFAVNARGRGHFFKTKEEASSFIQKLQAEGVKDFNVGCMQLNFLSHRKKFKSLGDMLDLRNNLEYAAKLLKTYHRKGGSWEEAVRLYKSGASDSTRKYQNLVFSIWAKVHVPKHLLKHEDAQKVSLQKKNLSKKIDPSYQISFAMTSPKARTDKFLQMANAKKAPVGLSNLPKANFFKIS